MNVPPRVPSGPVATNGRDAVGNDDGPEVPLLASVATTEALAALPAVANHVPHGGEIRARIRQEILAARRAGARDDTVEPLTASRIDAPLSLSLADGPVVDPPAQVRIRGYIVETEISRGGQASVFSAIHEATGRRVAVKVLAGGPLSSSKSRMRFDREVEALAKLDHPGIVGILDRGRTDDGTPFLVMNFIDGEDLDAYLRRYRGCHVKQVVRLFASIADTVHDAHVQGVVHRDLKPSNVRIDVRGEAHVLDFGLAQLMDAEDGGPQVLTTTGHLMGSLPWASPEQVSRSPVGPWSDVYALGVMLYQALTGEHPYRVTGGLHEIIYNIRNAPPAPAEKVKNGPFGRIDGTLAAILLRSLAKLPEDRYATAAALAEDLKAYCLDRPTSIPPRNAPHRGALAVAAVGCLFFCGVGALAVFNARGRAIVIADLPTITNDLGMRFVRVPEGRMGMGSPYHEAGRDEDEDRHTVRMTRGYFIGTTEVTRRQFERVMGRLPAGCDPALAANAPVDHVTWEDAAEFCRRLGEIDPAGRAYSLPTEAQWEYACRAGTDGPFARSGEVESVAWYAHNGGGKLHPVASKLPNHWGLYDVHGNVAEWCRDTYRHRLGLVARADPLIVAQESSRSARNIGRVVRGGSVNDDWPGCRSASRESSPADMRRAGIGFRVMVAEPASDGGSDPS